MSALPHPSSTVPEMAGSRSHGLRFLPGVDGLRALAVAAVLAYHGGLSQFSGGFLGVEVFLVISGYLITSLLLREQRSRRQIDLGRFWFRRARRLLPAVFVLLLVGLVGAVIFLPNEVAGLRGDVLASLGYGTNWYLIASDQSYFESFGRPSIFMHLWSLAVEEQFYIIWPIVFVVGMKTLGRRWFKWLVVAGALGSTALMWTMFDPGSDPSRVYYGTDTRAAGLLVGAALAFWWHPDRLRSDISEDASRLLDIVGSVSLLLLIRQILIVNEGNTSLYQGGFLHVSLLTAAVIAVAAHPATKFGRALGFAPLVWIGQRSYGIYLWHWPVFLLTRPGLDVDLTGPSLTALRLSVTLALAEISYRFIETPIRRGAISRYLVGLRASGRMSREQLKQRFAFTGITVSMGMLVLAGVVVAAESPPPTALDIQLGADGSTGTDGAVIADEDGSISDDDTGSVGDSENESGSSGSGSTDTNEVPVTTPTTVDPATVPDVLAMGDSVMLGAAEVLYEQMGEEIKVDSLVSRQWDEGMWSLNYYKEIGALPDEVVIHLGNNDYISDDLFDEMMEVLADVDEVWFLTVKVDREWQTSVNDVLTRGVSRHDNARIADWWGISHNQTGIFAGDGTHLTSNGAIAYTLFVETIIDLEF